MKLSKAEQERLQRGVLAGDFLKSEFFTKYLLPFVDEDRRQAYPDPSKKGWEDKYRAAYARDEVYTKLFTTVQIWNKEREDLTKKTNETEKDIMLA